MSSAGHGNPACPYLGLEDDADTSLAFPSVWNTCHRGRRVVFPSLDHQADHCLGENHRNCVAFSKEQVTLPQHLRASHSRAKKQPPRRETYRSFVFVLVGIVALVGLWWGWSIYGHSQPAANEVPSPAVTVLTTPLIAHTASFTHTPTVMPTVTPNPTATGEVVTEHRLEQPIGTDYKFVIHRVLDGENLNQCAARYNTSIEAIMLVTYDLKVPVWVGTLIVIPVGFTDVSKLPAFEPYEVIRINTSLQVLALEFGVSLEDLKYYNAIGTDEPLDVGDWLLIPRPRPVP